MACSRALTKADCAATVHIHSSVEAADAREACSCGVVQIALGTTYERHRESGHCEVSTTRDCRLMWRSRRIFQLKASFEGATRRPHTVSRVDRVPRIARGGMNVSRQACLLAYLQVWRWPAMDSSAENVMMFVELSAEESDGSQSPGRDKYFPPASSAPRVLPPIIPPDFRSGR